MLMLWHSHKHNNQVLTRFTCTSTHALTLILMPTATLNCSVQSISVQDCNRCPPCGMSRQPAHISCVCQIMTLELLARVNWRTHWRQIRLWPHSISHVRSFRLSALTLSLFGYPRFSGYGCGLVLGLGRVQYRASIYVAAMVMIKVKG